MLFHNNDFWYLFDVLMLEIPAQQQFNKLREATKLTGLEWTRTQHLEGSEEAVSPC